MAPYCPASQLYHCSVILHDDRALQKQPPPSLASRMSHEPCRVYQASPRKFPGQRSISLTYRWNCGDRGSFKSSTHGSLHIGGFFPALLETSSCSSCAPNPATGMTGGLIFGVSFAPLVLVLEDYSCSVGGCLGRARNHGSLLYACHQ